MAQRLLGSLLVRRIDDQEVIVKIVETEAYHELDAASHTYHGKTARNGVMYGPPGYLYVYFTYGMHYCANIVCGPAGKGSAVLIRAVEPIKGREIIAMNRPENGQGINLSNGPAKLCQALRIDMQLNGHFLLDPPLILELTSPVAREQIIATPRVGISKAKDDLLRFYIRDNIYVSKLT